MSKNNYQTIIDRYYESGSRLREILIRHSQQVASKALEIAESKHLGLNPDEIETAAMLHDIGIVHTNAPSIACEGDQPYICHGIIGAAMLREAGIDERYALVAERHTGAGLTSDDIDRQHLPLPPGDYMPETLLEKLICYADKFFSKSGDMKEKPIEKVRAQMSQHGEDTLQRFEKLHELFG